MQMVPVGLHNQTHPNSELYGSRPMMVTPGCSLHSGNMQHHDCHHKEEGCCKKEKKKNKKKEKFHLESESDAESKYYHMRTPGQHHSNGVIEKTVAEEYRAVRPRNYEIYAPSRPQYGRNYSYVNPDVRYAGTAYTHSNYGNPVVRQPGYDYMRSLQQYKEASARYNAGLNRYNNNNNNYGCACDVYFMDMFYDPYYSTGFYP